MYAFNPFTCKLDKVLNGDLYLLKSANLGDVVDFADARLNLGLIAGGDGDIWVEKAGDTMTGALMIDGSSDAIQLTVQGHSTQTNDLFVVEKSDGTNYFAVTGSGDIKTDSVTDTNVWLGIDAGVDGAGTNNIGIGASALYSNTTGNNNIAIGTSALYTNTTSIYNTAIGNYALYSNTTADYNFAIGNYALYTNTGTGNTAIGLNALYFNTTGTYNTAIGYQALFANTTGNNNLAIGLNALYINTAANYNTAIGISTLRFNTGSYNTAIGYQALYTNTTGNNNLAIGLNALYSNTTGIYNTAIGNYALYSNTTGIYNTAIGNYALYTNTTGEANVAIGYQAGYFEIGNNKLYIENSNSATPLIYGEFHATAGLITVHGKAIIDGKADSIQLTVQGNATQTSDLLVLEQSDGTDVLTVDNGGNMDSVGYVNAVNGFKVNTVAGWTGTFLNGGGATVTVTKGIIVSVI